MKCDGFEAVIDDLAKRVLPAERLGPAERLALDAAHRDRALAHAASCQRCAMRLTDERELTAGLQALAIASVVEAPARVEASLLAAFREQRAAHAASVRPSVPPRRATHKWMYVAAGVAAVVAIVLLVSLTISRRRDSARRQIPEQAVVTPAAADQHREAPLKSPESPTASEKNPPEKNPFGNNSLEKNATVASGGVKKTPRQNREPDVRDRRDRRDDSPAEAEIATDFFPLMQRGAGQLDSGQLVRIELPRSALMSFGLPMNMDRADERIKADVVVGNDGLARAIRFVR